MKILKNNTASDIELIKLGLTLLANSSYEIPVKEYNLLSSQDSVMELIPFITSEDIIINDGIEDLDVNRALIFITFPEKADAIIFNKLKFKAIEVNSGINEAKDFFSVFDIDEEINVPDKRQLIVYNLLKNDDILELTGNLILID
jgi:hypothetical protein